MKPPIFKLISMPVIVWIGWFLFSVFVLKLPVFESLVVAFLGRIEAAIDFKK